MEVNNNPKSVLCPHKIPPSYIHSIEPWEILDLWLYPPLNWVTLKMPYFKAFRYFKGLNWLECPFEQLAEKKVQLEDGPEKP